jgi:hypothetical protein
MHFLLSLAAVLASAMASPVESSTNEFIKRQNIDDWPRCVTLPEGECTLYIATGKSEYSLNPDSPYRNFALFDNACQLTHFVEETADNSWIVIQGNLMEAMAIELDMNVEPEGRISNAGDSFDFQDRRECRDWEELDGVGCRVSFACEEAY